MLKLISAIVLMSSSFAYSATKSEIIEANKSKKACLYASVEYKTGEDLEMAGTKKICVDSHWVKDYCVYANVLFREGQEKEMVDKTKVCQKSKWVNK